MKRTLKFIAIGTGAALLLAAAGVAALIVFPAPFLSATAKIISEKTPIKIEPGQVSGNLITGLVARNLSFDVPQAHISADRLHISVEWLKLLHRTVLIDKVEIDHPIIDVQTSSETSKEEKPASQWAIVANQVTVKKGIVRYGDVRVDDIDLSLRYADDAVDVASAHAVVSGTTVTAQGHVGLTPLKMDADGRMAGAFDGKFSVKGTTDNARGTLAGVFRKVKIDGKFAIKTNVVNWKANANGFGVDGDADGRYDIAAKNIDARWTAVVSSETLRQWTGGTAAHVQTSGSAHGVFPDLAVDVHVSMDKVRMRGYAFDSVKAEVDGRLASHRFTLDVQSTDYSLAAGGTGSYVDSEWNATWSKFNLHAIQNWSLIKPFVTKVASGRWSVTGLQLADQGTKFDADMAVVDGQWQETRFRTVGFDIANLSDIQLVKFPVKGIAKADVQLSGALTKPAIEGTLQLKGAELDGSAVGDLDGTGRFVNRSVRIDRLTLHAISSGTASISGNVEIPEGRAPIEFDVKLAAVNIDLSPVLKQSMVQTESSLLNADMRIEKTKRTVSVTGPMTLTAKAINVPTQGIFLQDAVIKLQGSGDMLKIIEGTAKSKKKGSVALSGSMSASTFDVKLNAKALPFDSELGVSGKLDADLALNGSIDEPRLKGEVYVLQADIMPAKARKKKEEEKPTKNAAPKAPSALAMDLDVSFDQNVWYKEKQTAIEMKGDLNVSKREYSPPIVTGTIESIRGTYILYGRAFPLDHARIVFTGDEDNNPLLDVLALYEEKTSKTTISLLISGTADDPRLTLSSDPPLEQTDIISVLVTGRPLDDPGNPNTNGENAAKATVANYFAEQVRSRVQSRAPIDVLQFNVNDQDQADLTVGKNVSRRLYVAYGQTLGVTGQQRVEATYSLGHFWSLEGNTASEGKYVIDLIYKLGLR